MTSDLNPNIILILIDGARIDRIHKCREFSEILSKGLLFSNMFTYAPYTLASMSAIFSGMYGFRNGVDAYNKMYRYNKDVKFLTEYLRDSGYHTVGDAMRISLIPENGFDKLTCHDEYNTDFIDIHNLLINETINETSAGSPFFLYLHYPKIHAHIVRNVFDNYDDFSREYFANKKQNLENYDNYLYEAGDYLSAIFKELERKDVIENSVIIVMADHGMGVGEKMGERAYGVFTYDYSIRTFATFINSHLFAPGKKIEELTRTVDVMPTILDILKIRPSNDSLQMHGESLLEFTNKSSILNHLIHRLSKKRISFSETGGVYGPWPSPSSPNVKCVRNKHWKLIHNLDPNTWELYNLEDDPLENTNLYHHENNTARKLKKEMEKLLNS